MCSDRNGKLLASFISKSELSHVYFLVEMAEGGHAEDPGEKSVVQELAARTYACFLFASPCGELSRMIPDSASFLA